MEQEVERGPGAGGVNFMESASLPGARDREGEKCEGRALGREARAEAEDWGLLSLARSHSGHH
jgi:hypothetical protein